MSQRISSLMDEFNAQTEEEDFENYRLWQNKVYIELRPKKTCIDLNFFVAVHAGIGHGAEAFNWLRNLSNKHDVKLLGVADPEEALAFYLKQGCIDEGDAHFSYTPE